MWAITTEGNVNRSGSRRPANGSAHWPISPTDAFPGDLAPDERALMELVAVGGTLGRAELETLAETTTVDTLANRGLLTRSENGRRLEVRLTHPLHGGVVRNHMSASQSSTVAQALAETVEATGARRQDDALRVASWRLICGGGRPETLLDGACAAQRLLRYGLAERLARAAVRAGAGFRAELVAARLGGLQGRICQAERELAALAVRASEDDQRGRIALARLDNSMTWTGVDHYGILDEAEATISDPAWLDKLQARRLGLVLQQQGPLAVASHTAELLQLADSGDDRDEQAEAHIFTCVTHAYSLGRLGHLGEAVDAATKGYATELMSGSTALRGWPLATRCLALGYAGRFREAEGLAVENHRQAVADRSAATQALFAIVRSAAVGERGYAQSTIPWTIEGQVLSQEVGRPLMVRLCHIYGALAFALTGRGSDASDALAASAALDLPFTRHNEVDHIRAQAWAAVASGHLGDGRRHLESAADIGDEIGDRVGGAAALHDLARLGSAEQVHERLAVLAGRIDGWLAPLRAAHAAALAKADAARLHAVSVDFEAIGTDLLAAEAAADAAVTWRRAGERSRAASAKRRVALLAARCEHPVTPALQAVEARALLTPAEWDTALAAAAGHPSKQIARELSLSVRTIENQLQRSYTKLGVSSRFELSGALNRPEAACAQAAHGS